MKLITDRKQTNITRLAELSRKRWEAMDAAEQAEWSGNPLTAAESGYSGAVNLLPTSGLNVTVRDGSIYATTSGSITIVHGGAEELAGNAVTLSAEYVSPGGQLTLEWSNGTAAGIVLTAAGSVTETLAASKNTLLRLKVSPGYYGKVMLELGRVPHEYVPYTEIVPTEATMGAYNFSDLNRVERAVKEIAEILGVAVVTKTNWSVWDTPSKQDLDRYLGNVRLLQELCGETTVLPDNLSKMTFDTANKIEAALLRCRKVVERLPRCGETICGEVL